jgi:hypothetical protein
VTGKFWNVIGNLNLNWYRTHIDMIGTILREVDFYKKHPRVLDKLVYVNWQEIKYVYTIWAQLNVELKDLEKLLPVTRKMIVLLNFGGDVLNFLLGTATGADLQTLHQVVDRIPMEQNVMTNSIGNELTYTKELSYNFPTEYPRCINISRGN